MKNFILKPIHIQIFNSLVATHPQFKEESLLFDEIQEALGCSKSNAKDYAKTHCNLFSFYAVIRAAGFYNKSYSEFFKFCLDKNFCNAKGFILVLKPVIAEDLEMDLILQQYREYEDILDPFRLNKDRFVQYKIKGNTTGDHFMGGFISGGQLYLSDTSYRGIGVLAEEHITPKNFQWVMEV